jgi:hypothetical protein
MTKQSDMHTKMKGRNRAVLGAILGFVVLIIIVTLVKFGGGA